MMATTHALAGVVPGTVMRALVPGAGVLPVLTATLGGPFPDFDLYAGYRKTLHFPVYSNALAVPAVTVAALNPTTTTLAVALFLAATVLHSVSDVLGGGLGLRPRFDTSERAVYDHWNGRWLAPRRLIHYDGAPEDLTLTLAFAVPPVLAFDGLAETPVIGTVAVSGAYVLLRKPTVAIAEAAVVAMSDHVVDLMPEQFVHNFR